MDAQSLRGLDRHYYLTLALLFFTLVAAIGGASRADELQQAFVRLTAILAIGAALWPLELRVFRHARGPVAGIALVYLLLLIQLLPLPAATWAHMPGHHVYADVALRARVDTWRPSTLSPDLTLNAVGALLPATAMGLLALALDFRERLLLARLIVALACLSAIFGLLQFAAGESALHLFRTTSENSAVGLFANRNHQAALMACALPILAAVASIQLRHQQGGGRWVGGIAAVAAAILLMALVSTGSRMGILLGAVGLAAAVAIAIVTAGQNALMRITVRALAVGGAATVAACAGVWMLVLRSGVAARLANEPIDQTRVASLGPMLNAARAFMPFGSGFGTFQPVYQRFEPDSLLSTIYLNQAHNEPMQLAIEGGLPAIALLLMFVGWWAFAAVRSMRQGDSASRRALGMAMAATGLILMLSSLVDYPLRTPLLSSLFTISCIELLRSRRRPASKI